MNDAPHVLQHREMLVSGRGWPRADFWRTGYVGDAGMPVPVTPSPARAPCG